MSSLMQAPLAPILERLFAEDDAYWSKGSDAMRYWSDLPVEERQRRIQSKTDYRALYAALADAPLAISRETGRLLYMLARNPSVRMIVEFGTSFGLSTLHLASALKDSGGGRLVTTEFEHAKVAEARFNLMAAGLSDLVEIREGDALETLATDLPDSIDLVLLDGAKGLYTDVLDLLESRLRPGALVLADDADQCPDYLDRVRHPENGYLSVSVANDIELSLRLG